MHYAHGPSLVIVYEIKTVRDQNSKKPSCLTPSSARYTKYWKYRFCHTGNKVVNIVFYSYFSIYLLVCWSQKLVIHPNAKAVHACYFTVKHTARLFYRRVFDADWVFNFFPHTISDVRLKGIRCVS